MNSYLLTVRSASGNSRERSPLLRLAAEESMSLNASTEVALMGKLGDVSLSVERDVSALVLSGYIAEAEGFTGGTDSQRNCDELHRLIRARSDMPGLLEFVSSACGSFSLVVVDLASGCITSITDRHASRPVWHRQTGERLYISSHAVPVANAISNDGYDLGGLASYLLYGTQVDPEISIFSGVRSQDEGTAVVHQVGRTSEDHRWYSYVHRPEVGRPLEHWLDSAEKALTSSASRVLKVTPDPLLFLSGGVDSRIAGAALVAVGARPQLLTLADSDNLEVRVAKAVAKVFHCPHDIHYRDTGYYLRAMEHTMQYANGSHVWIHGHFAEAYQLQQAQHSTGGAMLGDFCEAFSKMCCRVPLGRSRLWSPPEFLRDFDELPLSDYAPLDRLGTLSLLSRDLRFQAESELQDNIMRRYEHASAVSADPAIVADYFFRWQRGPCHATFQMFHDLRSAGPERNLMFDPDVHKLIERLPSETRSSQRMGSKLVHRLHPAAALIPDANSLVPLLMPQGVHAFAKYMRPKLGILRRRLLSSTHETTASWPHIPLLMQNDANWRTRIEDLLLDTSLLNTEYFDRSAIEKCWRSFLDGEIRLHSDLEKLSGLACLARLTN